MNQKIIVGWCLGGTGLIHQARKKNYQKSGSDKSDPSK